VVVDRDNAAAARGFPADAPLSATSVDRSTPMLLGNHPIHLALVQLALA
jgi:hypothetical protein